jgi:hypothetical protein
VFQDTYDVLFSGKSSRDKGTLYHLRNIFDHRKVTSNVKDSFNANAEFLQFVTDVYVILCMLHNLSLRRLSDTPPDFPTDKKEALDCLHNMSTAVVDTVYMHPNVADILRPIAPPARDMYGFCVCRVDLGSVPMIFCNNKTCVDSQWFHMECVGVDPYAVPDGNWYCSERCKSTLVREKSTSVSKSIDGKREYAKAVIWHGLSHMVRKDAVLENDGNRMVVHWKHDFLKFYIHNHPKYFLFCHRLLMSLNGAVSERLRHELRWNRTVNRNGGQGRNIEMDLQMEFFNKDYKGKA